MAQYSGVAVVAIAVLLLAGIGAVDQASFSVGDKDQLNESFTPDAGNVTQLDQSDRDGVDYGEEVVVKDENGTLAADGTDYTWNATNGTITTLTGGILDNDSNATIEYEYAALTQPQQDSVDYIVHLLNVSPALVLIAAAAVVLFFLRGLVG